MEYDDVMRERASVKNYSSKRPDILMVMDCLEAANLAPTPGNLGLLKYTIVENQEKKDEIASACQQPFIANAPYLVVVCTNIKDAELMFDKRAKKYATQHAGAAIENFLLKITELGLVSCWIGAFSDRMIKDTLSIPDDIEIEAILPVAYRPTSDHTVQKRKHTLDARVFFEKYGNKFRKAKEKVRFADI